MKNGLIIGAVCLFILAFFLGGILFGAYLTASSSEPQITSKSIAIDGERTKSITIVAVDSNGKGTTGTLSVTLREGNGKILVNVNDILANLDVQQSARTAAAVAGTYSHIDISKLDIIYSIKAKASIIAGMSAGSAMAAVTVAALEDHDINPQVLLSGAILPDGRVGPVSGLGSKAQAAKAFGATAFLVPKGQTETQEYNIVESCMEYEGQTLCRPEYALSDVNLNSVGIEVEEVGNIQDVVNAVLI